jgi:hypothetical protein
MGEPSHRPASAFGRLRGGLLLRGSKELDPTRQVEVEEFFSNEKPQYVFIPAARVGGILANNTYVGYSPQFIWSQ